MKGIYRTTEVAHWFLRLNGCFSITNFVVHPLYRYGSAQTDGDIISVRMPERCELRELGEGLVDHAVFTEATRLDFLISEVKAGPCALNPSWTDRERNVITYVLNAAGLFAPTKVVEVAEELYECGCFDDGKIRCRMLAFGREIDTAVKATQLTWSDAFVFIHRRFWEHRRRKSDHGQWSDVGRQLFDHATSEPDPEAFVSRALKMLV